MVCVPMIRYRDQSIGYMMVDMAPHLAAETQMHMIAFESRRDAEAVRHLYQANIDSDEAIVHVVGMSPAKLKEVADHDVHSISVYKPGQLKVKPGMTANDLAGAAAAAGSGSGFVPEEVLSH